MCRSVPDGRLQIAAHPRGEDGGLRVGPEQLLGQRLELGKRAIRVVGADTDVTPYDTITAGSRSTYHTGNAVRRAAEEILSLIEGDMLPPRTVVQPELVLRATTAPANDRVIA